MIIMRKIIQIEIELSCDVSEAFNYFTINENTGLLTQNNPYDFDVSIDGDLVNDDIMYNSGSTYGFKFETDASATNVSFSIINNDTNTLTVTNLSFAHCGPTVSAAITTQPECLGATAELTATVTGSGSYVYQWEESSDGGTNWTDITNGVGISGATSTTLSFNSWNESNIFSRCTPPQCRG